MNLQDIELYEGMSFETPQRHVYTTRHSYGRHPAGTECIAYRALRTNELCLEFPDGTTTVLPSHRHLEGIEPANPFYVQQTREGELLCS